MLVRIFRLSQPKLVAFLILPVLFAGFASYKWNFSTLPPNGLPFYDLIYSTFATFPSYVRVLLVSLLLFQQAIHLNYVLNKHELLLKKSWMPALMYVIIGSLLPPFQWFHPMIFVNTLLIFALDKVFQLYKNDRPLKLDFDTGFIIGLASMFYLPLLVFIFFFGSALILLRHFSWRDWVTGIIGVMMPLFFAFCYYFLTDHLMLLYEKIMLAGIRRPKHLGDIFPKGYLFSILLIGVISLLSIFKQQANYFKNVTKTRLNHLLIILFAITGIITSLFTETPMVYRFYILVIPLSVWAAYFFLSMKRLWLSELILLLLISCWVYNYYITAL